MNICRYGFDTAIEESEPTRADIVDLKKLYDNGTEDDKFMLDSTWYRYPQFQVLS